MKRLVLFLSALLLVIGCQAHQRGDGVAVVAVEKVSQGLLGPGDIFEVAVYGEKELSGPFRISSDGSIDFPLVGRIMVGGLSSDGVQQLLTERLMSFLKSPQVSIFVKEFNSQKVYVYGQVQKSGTFRYEQGMSIVQAITLAGGFTKVADKDGVVVTRRIDEREQTIRVSVEDIGRGKTPNLNLNPGDIVFVPETMF
ncbi:MAG: polysaccharide biosynthesis/export family protein [Myxococcota bacterium]